MKAGFTYSILTNSSELAIPPLFNYVTFIVTFILFLANDSNCFWL